MSHIPDHVLLALYGMWSETFSSASFLEPDPDTVLAFRDWLKSLIRSDYLQPYEDFELEMIQEFHRQAPWPTNRRYKV